MERLLYVCIIGLALAGCRGPQKAEKTGVVVVGSDRFPASLAGRWVSDRQGWQIVFGADGRITSAVLSLGRVEVVPGVETTVPTRGGGQGVFAPGLWTVHYEADSKQLTVKLVMNHIRIEMGSYTLEGKSTDVFSGPISADDGVWQVQWTALTDYEVRRPGREDVEIGTDSVYGETQPLAFEKTEPQ